MPLRQGSDDLKPHVVPRSFVFPARIPQSHHQFHGRTNIFLTPQQTTAADNSLLFFLVLRLAANDLGLGRFRHPFGLDFRRRLDALHHHRFGVRQ